MKKLLMLLLCITIPLTFLIGCGEKQVEEEAEQQVEQVQEEVVEEAAPDTAVVDTTQVEEPATTE